MKKPARNRLRNKGWLADELKTLFEAELFTDSADHPDPEYWVPVIVAHTGARLSEVVGMKVPDVTQRHGLWTFYLAKEAGKSEDSRGSSRSPRRSSMPGSSPT